MNKNLAKFVQYIFPSSKQWTGIRFSAYRDLRLHFDCIGRESIDIIVLGCNLCTIIAKSFIRSQREGLTKVLLVMSTLCASGNGPKPECWVCWPLGKVENSSCKQTHQILLWFCGSQVGSQSGSGRRQCSNHRHNGNQIGHLGFMGSLIFMATMK